MYDVELIAAGAGVTTMSHGLRTLVGLVGIALVGAGSLRTAEAQDERLSAANGLVVSRQTAESSVASPARAYRRVLDRYCVTCHNERLRTANLMLDTISLDAVSQQADVWEKVVRKLRTGAMPPPGRPRPGEATYHGFAAWLETGLDQAAARNPNPGHPGLSRLNRTEYTNAIRDLLALDVDGRALLPADNSGYGFDNIADVLSVSPGLMARYLTAAVKISRLAVGDPTLRPTSETYRVPPLFLQDDRMSEDLPFGTRGGLAVRHFFPLDGEYVLKVRLQRTFADVIRGLHKVDQVEIRLDRARLKLFTIGGQGGGGEYGPSAADEGLELRVPVKAGTRLVGVAFLKGPVALETEHPLPPVAGFDYSQLAETDAAVGSLEITGPYAGAGSGQVPEDTPSRHRIFVCYPASRVEEAACAERILRNLAGRAYRQAVTDKDLQTLLSFYERGRIQGGFDAGIQSALERVLISPKFLFRFEPQPPNVTPGTPYRLGDFELASRLSFFLWASIPDDELLNLAEWNKLSDPTVLEQQVRRMLDDPRSKSLVNDFAGQWLYLRNLRSVAPNPDEFPEFDDNLREAFQRETELFVESQLREDRSVLDLLRADYTFVNERLARHYGIPNVYGSRFRRVPVSDENRVGLLGQGSFLTVTSPPNRTSPVVRGKWLLENLLGAPPPPPPPDVPALKESDEEGKPASVRERLELHRRSPICASCHASMDPLGFALENFDAVGKWRTHDENTPIDASGTLPDGTTFNGPAEFRNALLRQKDQFVNTVTEKLLTYAIGRGLEYYDAPAVRQIMRKAAPSDYSWSSLILGVVRSTPFQMKMTPDGNPGAGQ